MWCQRRTDTIAIDVYLAGHDSRTGRIVRTYAKSLSQKSHVFNVADFGQDMISEAVHERLVLLGGQKSASFRCRGAYMKDQQTSETGAQGRRM